jgi:hypothetical protein
MSSDEAAHSSSGSESGGEGQDEGRVERAVRRLRQEKKNEELLHILYNPEALSRLTRSQTEKTEVMETDGEGAGTSGKPDPAGEREGADGKPSVPPTPPPMPLQKPPSLVPTNMNVNKIVLNHVKATLPANQVPAVAL